MRRRSSSRCWTRCSPPWWDHEGTRTIARPRPNMRGNTRADPSHAQSDIQANLAHNCLSANILPEDDSTAPACIRAMHRPRRVRVYTADDQQLQALRTAMSLYETPTDEAASQPASSNAAAIALLKDAISYAENRINLVDGKAALMLTAVTALFASLVFAAGDLPEVTSLWSASALVYGLLGGALILGAFSVGFLLQTIRHGRFFFGIDVPIRRHDVRPNFMWPTAPFPDTFEEFRAQALQITDGSRLENLAGTTYTTLQLVRLKYRNYRRAMLYVKLLGAWTAISLFVLGLVRATGRL